MSVSITSQNALVILVMWKTCVEMLEKMGNLTSPKTGTVVDLDRRRKR